MGGQACVFYGAAEFSRDCDIVIVADAQNFSRLTAALDELQATCIAVPPMVWSHLDRGHAIHFRCHHPDASGIRLYVMTKMRGCGDFELLWEQAAERAADQAYWRPLVKELEAMRFAKRNRDASEKPPEGWDPTPKHLLLEWRLGCGAAHLLPKGASPSLKDNLGGR
jgi:hypothetical protein